ncbi:hypothetical protein F2Q70_00020271 [Brassica cretica]|uniref:Arabidopsis retrotransposon Orf1 C-terminal domain-containing protein n=1 Tax=Brassica cretica TaxID=69181 RepID=A0A8S9GK87_BRACR|nr:hypothetical protein F2Q70_00020271 [Brassica cretica]
MGATLPERRHELAVPYLSERPYQSDLTRSLAISSFWSAKIDPERPPRATTRSRSSSRARDMVDQPAKNQTRTWPIDRPTLRKPASKSINHNHAAPGVLPLPSTDIYATFGMVSFFVSRLEHYRDWAWYTSDSRPKVEIGGLITPLLQFMNVPLGKDAAGPRFIDGTYLRIATYFSGMYVKNYVYYYYLKGKPVEVVLPNKNLTSLERPEAISFNISQEDFLGEHGSLGPIAALRKRSAPTRHDEPAAEASEPVYGPPRYYFKPYDGVLPPDALRDAHEHIG